MSSLDAIGVTVEQRGGGTGHALLREIAQRLERLLMHGETSSIDLARLPLAPAERALLASTLGEGEVQARLDSLGPSTVRETAIAGVWWVTHYNSDEEVTAEFIEVTRCPELLFTPHDDLHDAVALLRTRLLESENIREEDHGG